MKRYIIIDDNNLSGYASIAAAGDVYSVYVNIKEVLRVPIGCIYKVYLINGANTYYLGIPEFYGKGLFLKKEFEKSYFNGFLADAPSKIKFAVESMEADRKKPEDKKAQTPQKEDASMRTKLSRYLQVFDIFKDEFPNTTWYRVHDFVIVFDTEFAKRVMHNISVIKSINILKHYLIGVGKDKKILYAIPARYGIDPNPFAEGTILPKWVPTTGQEYKFGNFGYFIISENNLDRAEYFAKNVE